MDNARTRADESVSTRFTRVMNATLSPLGVLTEPALLALFTSIFFLITLGLAQSGASTALVYAFGALAALPVTLGLLTSIALMGGRKRLVSWLASLPFPLENMNAVMNGLGELLEITFKQGGPTSAELNEKLDTVHPDCFVAKVQPEEGTPEVIEIRIGVVDSKILPSRSSHQRYKRVHALVHQVLIPLSEQSPIIEVRVK